MTPPHLKPGRRPKAAQTGPHVDNPFRQHYENRGSEWGVGSGPGSSAFFTLEYQVFLSKFIHLNTIRSVTDIGCGDWQFSKFVNFATADYLGLDVVDSVIERNEALHGGEGVSFRVMPQDLSDIGPADLLLMKDVLQHLPNAEIARFRDELFPKFKFCLITNSYQKLDTPSNVDVEAGSFRCLDLTAPPYSMRGAYVLEFGTAVWERVRVFLYQS